MYCEHRKLHGKLMERTLPKPGQKGEKLNSIITKQDSPAHLLENKDSIFSSMARDAGLQ